MTDPVEMKVEELLLAGKGRHEIYHRLKNNADQSKLIFHINNSALPEDRNKYRYLNLFLCIILLYLTAKKIPAIFVFDILTVYLLLSLVVPVINIYVLREVMRFHRVGYQFLIVISLLSLFQPENHNPVEGTICVLIAVIAFFLYCRLFPASSALNPEKIPT